MALMLTADQVRGLLPMREAIEAVEAGFRALAEGRVDMPHRTVIRLPEHRATHLAMPAYVRGDASAMAVKLITTFPDNPTLRRLPTALGLLVLHDPESGRALSVMEAGSLTAIRTGAATGVATRHLARPAARRVGLVGAGVQAHRQLEAVMAIRAIFSVNIYDRDLDRARRLSDKVLAELGIDATVVKTPAAAVGGADIVLVATSSPVPVVEGRWLTPGQHLALVGAHTPDTREIDTEGIVRSRVFVDDRETCLAEAGELLIPIREGAIGPEHIRGSIGEVVTGQVSGRTGPEEITLFKSVGLAIQDVVAAAIIYERARAQGIGVEFDFGT